MTFHTVKLPPSEIAQLLPAVYGPVLSFSPTCAVDEAYTATFVALGGQPWRDPADAEPPGHFNLLWQGHAVLATGYYTQPAGENGDSTVSFNLSLSVPQTLAHQIDEVKRLVAEGLIVYWKSLTPFPLAVQVEILEVTYY